MLRASGFKPLHDEVAIFAKSTAAARKAGTGGRQGIVDDWYSFTIAFKSVLLEGLEIAFIVVTFGVNRGSISLAAAGAVAAIVAIVAIGAAVHKPLAQVPENALKFVVGIMLATFGIFWGAEGSGVQWPGSDAALLGILAFIAITAFLQIAWLRGRYNRLQYKEIAA